MKIVHALLSAALLAAPAAATAHPHGDASSTSGQRDRWYIGFGLGSGGGSFGLDGARTNFRQAHGGPAPVNLAFQLELGATLTPSVLLGGEISGIVSYADVGGADSTLTTSQLLLVTTWFPMRRGLFLRGGAGLAGFEQELDDGAFRARARASGVGLLGGVGYAWWLGERFNLTTHVDVNGHAYVSGDGPDNSATVTAYLGFRWY
jgi:hypothetical protein